MAHRSVNVEHGKIVEFKQGGWGGRRTKRKNNKQKKPTIVQNHIVYPKIESPFFFIIVFNKPNKGPEILFKFAFRRGSRSIGRT